ncbi:MAG: pyridoxine 5'-phosphate synthase [Deltaproteobacteria bacterium]|nr:pyridoxine 5'-phosphate synthase [Deltaproteobacteria bacterium]MBW2593099.1 pyridoxine 5'-phosphate synthase [Deltaproteobacteria bacterium]
MAGLIVNIDRIAALRQIGKAANPDPAAAAVLIETAGAEGVAVHLWEDRRHIQDRDVRILRQIVQSMFILEIAPTSEMAGIALDLKPDRIVLVPEKYEESTPAGGLDLIVHKDSVAETISTFQNNGLSAGVLIDPDPEQIRIAHLINANWVTLYLKTFRDAKTAIKKQRAFDETVDAIKLSHRLNLQVTVCSGLDYHTIRAFRKLPEIDEFVVGHGIVARALLTGLDKAVRDMLDLIKSL